MAPPRNRITLRKGDGRRHWRRWLLLAIVIVVVIGSARTCTLVTGRSNPIDSGLMYISAPVIRAVHSIGNGFASLRHVFRIPRILRENRELQVENGYLTQRVEQLLHYEQENRRLNDLLNIKAPADFSKVTARVIARPPELWLDSVSINAGTRKGVHEGNLVANSSGVVGIVSRAELDFSNVTLISSPEFVLGAITGSSSDPASARVEGVLKGIEAGRMRLDLVPAGAPVAVGDKVFTLGEETIDGGEDNRPRGLYFGLVVRREEDPSDFLDIIVEPLADVNRLGEVVVYTR
jgi:rod shape-determining protein MreC